MRNNIEQDRLPGASSRTLCLRMPGDIEVASQNELSRLSIILRPPDADWYVATTTRLMRAAS